MKKLFKNPKYILLLIFLCTFGALLIDLPRIPIKFEYGGLKIDQEIGGYQLNLFNGSLTRSLEIKKGLDIAGGVSVLLKADMANIGESDQKEALDSLKEVIERRVNLLGISEANVQTSTYNDEHRVIVELAGVFDTTAALDTIGQVAQLEFRLEDDQSDELQDIAQSIPQFNIPTFSSTDLNGSDLRKASVVFGGTSGVGNQPQVQLQFNSEGTKKFRELTKNNIGKRLAIYIDEEILTAPTVQTAINDGTAVITGQFDIDEAKALVTQLNAGALPVPVEVLEQKTVGPTLGNEAVVKNIYAGLVGLSLVVFFMIAYYGRLGFLASISLVIYGLFTLAIYKLVPVVLTLPGLAGFILSIGMAVDANILIFERIKEELALKKPWSVALENGFGRSWDSIRDANVATLLTAFVLFNPFDWGFLPTSGLVRGFALTLSLGVLMSLFTGVYLTRNLVRVFYKKK